MNHGFLMFRFTSSSDRDRGLLEGPWVLDDAVLAVRPWTPSFRPTPAALPPVVLWIFLSDLPPVFWT